MFIKAEVIYAGTNSEEKEVRITVQSYNEQAGHQEDICWITRDMLKEVLTSGSEEA